MTKRIWILLLAVCVALGTLAIGAAALETPTGTIAPAIVNDETVKEGWVTIYSEANITGTDSMVVKLYAGDELLGSSTLVDTDKVLLCGEARTVTYHIFLKGQDSWWDTQWEGLNPIAGKVPDRVELWVDGVKVAENVVRMANSNDNLGAAAVNYTWGNLEGVKAAKIGDVYYGSLQEAIDAAAGGQTVTLLGNITIDAKDDQPATHAWVKEDDNVIIDLNGYTVTGAFFVNGTATIKNGSIVNNSYVSGIETKGNLTLENMTVTSDRHAVRVSGGSTTILSGTYQTVASSGTAHAVNVSNAAVTIKGGTLIGAGQAGNGAGGNCLMLQAGSTAAVSGGNFYGSNNVEGAISPVEDLQISGGTFCTWTYDQYLADGKAAKKLSDTKYEVVDAVAKAGTKGYASLQEAVDAAAGQKAVTLLAAELSENISITKDLTLELGANKLVSTVSTDGSATVTVSGTNSQSAVTLPALTERAGYTFGWYAGQTAAEKTEAGFKVVPQQTALTYEAKYVLNTYTVAYELNGGVNHADNPASYTVESETVALNAPTRKGYTFGGWYEAADLSGTAVTQIPQGSVGSKRFYAKWNAITYTVTYDADGGTNPDNAPTVHTYGTETVLPTPVWEGHVFEGWFTDSSFSGSALTALAADGYTENITLYAKWRVKTAPDPTLVQQKYNYTGKDISYTLDGGYTIVYKQNGKTVTPRNAGVYDVYVTRAEDDQYYAYSGQLQGGLIINKAVLTVTYAGETVEHGVAPKLELTVKGFVGSETAATAAGYMAPTLSNTNTAVGAYTLTPAGGQADNYTFTYVSGTLTIEKHATGFQPEGIKYIVEHYKSATNGYTLADTEVFAGKVGDTVTAVPKDYQGFSYQAGQSTDKGTLKAISSDADILVLKLYYDAIVDYVITQGNGQSVEQGSDATFVSNADISTFVEVLVDGKVVEPENYTVVAGSIKVTLKQAFLDTLSVGEHTVSIVSTNGQADAVFTVALRHSFTVLEKDETHHWYACEDDGCQEADGKQAHEFGPWVTVTAPTAEKAGTSERTCKVCDYKQTKEVSLPTNPVTGDGILPMLGLMLLSGMGLVAMWVISKKRFSVR